MYATEPLSALDALDVYIALLCFAALLLIDFAIYAIRQKRKSSALKGQRLGAPRAGGGDGGADF
jgi:hypothetical protein